MFLQTEAAESREIRPNIFYVRPRFTEADIVLAEVISMCLVQRLRLIPHEDQICILVFGSTAPPPNFLPFSRTARTRTGFRYRKRT